MDPPQTKFESGSSESSLSVGSGLSLSDSSPSPRKPKKKKISDLSFPMPKASVRLPNRHRSLIGHREERDFLASKLELSRKPCNLYELRRCRRMLYYCEQICDLCKKYCDPFFPFRDNLRGILNSVKLLPVRQLLDLVQYPYKCYSPLLPAWLNRILIKSINLGNLLSRPIGFTSLRNVITTHGGVF